MNKPPDKRLSGFAETIVLKTDHEQHLMFDKLRDELATLRARLELAEKVVEAARVYRDRVDYTGGDNLNEFAGEQGALDAALDAYDAGRPQA